LREENLLFIASQPRAGSTYLQNLLSNNPYTNTVSEPWILLAMAPLLKPALVRQATYDHRLAMDAFDDYQNKVAFNFKHEIKELILKSYDPLKAGFDLVIDKTPRYWEILDEIVELFPKAKILIIQRNPIDVVKSMIETWNIETLERLNYYHRDLLLAPIILKDFSEKHISNSRIKSIHYKELKTNTKKIVSELYKWLEIPFDEKVLDTSGNDKFKGKYGDPYQNNKQKKEKELKPNFKEFIKGYIAYLDTSIVNEYGIDKSDARLTLAFKYFLNLGEGRTDKTNNSLYKELALFSKRIRIK
jgi:hypothetical protein